MIPEIYSEIIKKLKDKTIADKVNWVESAADNTFVVNMTDSSLSIKKDFGWGEDKIVFALLNENGQMIDNFDVSDKEDEWVKVDDLYVAARRRAMGVDETLKKLRKKIESSDIIGDVSEE